MKQGLRSFTRLATMIVCTSSASSASSSLAAASAAHAESPVILVPGFMGWTEMETFGVYFGSLRRALTQAGADVFPMAPPPIASSEQRAKYVERKIDAVLAATGASKVAIIAHSQGGLDVRSAIADGYADKISVVVTLSTPHEGTDLADAAIAWFPDALVQASLSVVQRAWQDEQHVTFSEAADAPGALRSLSRANAKAFNATHDDRGVMFFSIGAVTGDDVDRSCASGGKWGEPDRVDVLHPLFNAAHTLIRLKGGDESDDGVVPVSSMKHGIYLGCVPADHADWIGWKIDRDNDGYVEFDERAFLVELWRGMRDVENEHDVKAMDAHVPALAKLAHAKVLSPAAGAAAEVAHDAAPDRAHVASGGAHE